MTKERCERCGGWGIVPSRMNWPNGPICGCGKPSLLESGSCSETCMPICDCPAGEMWKGGVPNDVEPTKT